MSDYWTLTYPTRSRVDYMEPDPANIHLSDIGWALSREARWCNFTPYPHSVLYHMIQVGDHLPTKLEIFGYLHDATEAFMRDIPKPLKDLCPGYREVERRLLHCIYRKYAGRIPTGREEEVIKEVDLQFSVEVGEGSEGLMPRDVERKWMDRVRRLI